MASKPSQQGGSADKRTELRLDVRASLSGIDPLAWNTLAGDNPFVRYELLHALHETNCASEETGWLPQFLTVWEGERLRGAMPLYLKSHSYGEYVFDWAWADAYQRHGLKYYPKLLSAIPFSPVSAPKILADDDAVRDLIATAALDLGKQASSLHVLFPTEAELLLLESKGMMVRRGVQFHWTNEAYSSFDEFLARFSHDKRKKIKQERRKVAEAGITFRRLTGSDIKAADWAFFNRCYRGTYRAHHSTPYLNLAFFETLGEKMGENVLLVIAVRDGKPIASALNVYTQEALYGRYWGTLEYQPALHFEACYYQALEFCIERGIKVFEGGAQGEHKLARGFMPVEIRSAHWLKRPEFADAIERFLAKEASGIGSYIDELREHAPYKSEST